MPALVSARNANTFVVTAVLLHKKGCIIAYVEQKRRKIYYELKRQYIINI